MSYGYEFQINYDDTKKPIFRSDRYQLDVPQNVPQDNMEDQIIGLIQKNNKMSTEKMAMILGVSSKTVKRRIKQMDHVNYIGRGSNGHWEISEEK